MCIERGRTKNCDVSEVDYAPGGMGRHGKASLAVESIAVSVRRFGMVLAVAVAVGVVVAAVDRLLIQVEVGVWVVLTAVVIACALACERPTPTNRGKDDDQVS